MAEPEAPTREPEPGGKEHKPGRVAEQSTQRDLREELSDQRKQSRISAQNLDALYADTVIGGDDIAGASHRASDGGTVNAAGRDQYFIGWSQDDKAVRTVGVPARTVGIVRRCHAPTESSGMLSRRLHDEHVLLLRGEPHSGQPTAALAALARWTGDDGRLAWLHLGRDPLRLVAADLRDATGYIVTGGDDATWSGHADQVLGHLCRVAERAGARIVVLAGPGFPEHDWTVRHEPPPLDNVFANWLVHELCEGGEAHPQERADKTAADELVREKLARYRRPREARALALQVATGLLRGRSVGEILEALPEQRRLRARTLLARETPRRARSFLIAGSVLSGSAAAVVATQTLRLATLIEEELARQTTVEQPRRHHMWEWLSDWTEDTGIRVKETGQGGDGQVVEFDEPPMAGSILRVVWEEQPTIHEPLLAWLHQLTENEEFGTRMKAAEAIGLLATYDFHAICDRFLEEWRDSKEFERRELAAWALVSAARDPQVEPRVLECLGRWARNGRRAQSVVIRACGSWLGARHVEEALRVLRDIAKTSGYVLAESVARAVSQIHQDTENAEVPENTRRIISALVEWSADPESKWPGRAAALAFVRLLASPDAIRVIDLAADPGAADDLVALWRHILLHGVTRGEDAALTPEAWDLLSDWLGRWEADAGVRRVLSEVLTRPPGELRMSLSFHLRLWSRIGKVDAEVAARVAALIEGS
ncbi:hypothetical protein FLW53_04700 [Microbispora sp. SCL1-1]|uniref:hypothetical protein n=1 Tax=unclassified Microbispora TaxID=2614687 RepID=UPI00115B50D0|nr:MULTISPECIES: hypothetical protein [unclassified Microbispora]NJP23513.1 hypothetical protein [Microbispora sp. CL1-1]TQS15747.1 hypothetical protein FLW53_04700 [Microbispora sp. SCL1-1]